MMHVKQAEEMRQMEILQENPLSQLSDTAATVSAVSPTTACIIQGPKQELLFSILCFWQKAEILNCLSVNNKLLVRVEQKESKAVTTGLSKAVLFGQDLGRVTHQADFTHLFHT